MVTKQQLTKHADFLRQIHDAPSVVALKRILRMASHACIKVLLSIVRDCLYKKIPLDAIDGQDHKKLMRYKKLLRHVASLNPQKER